jgi:hypothetical protein
MASDFSWWFVQKKVLSTCGWHKLWEVSGSPCLLLSESVIICLSTETWNAKHNSASHFVSIYLHPTRPTLVMPQYASPFENFTRGGALCTLLFIGLGFYINFTKLILFIMFIYHFLLGVAYSYEGALGTGQMSLSPDLGRLHRRTISHKNISRT